MQQREYDILAYDGNKPVRQIPIPPNPLGHTIASRGGCVLRPLPGGTTMPRSRGPRPLVGSGVERNGLHWQQGTVDRRLRPRDFLRTRRGFSLDYRLSSGFPDQGSIRAASGGPDHFRTSTRHLERGSGCCGDSHGGPRPPGIFGPRRTHPRRTPASLRRTGDRPGVADGVILVQFLQFQHQRRHGRLTPGHPARPGPGPDVGTGQRETAATTAHCCTSIPPLAEERPAPI